MKKFKYTLILCTKYNKWYLHTTLFERIVDLYLKNSNAIFLSNNTRDTINKTSYIYDLKEHSNET